MNLKLIKVSETNGLAHQVFKILKDVGEHMYINEGLNHWYPSYPLGFINRDLNNDAIEIYLVVNDKGEYLATFQIKIFNDYIELNKFATVPKYQSIGVGTWTINSIIRICKEKKIYRIRLEVYDKSINSILFYEKKGFTVIGERKTTRFIVKIMEKTFDI